MISTSFILDKPHTLCVEFKRWSDRELERDVEKNVRCFFILTLYPSQIS